jgi:nicotinamide-nucleotide amidase
MAGDSAGHVVRKDGKIFVSMPGVPHEMKGMMTTYVLPRLPGYFSMPAIYSRTLLTAGIGESFLAELIRPIEEKLPSHIKLAYLPNYGMVRLRLTGTGTMKEVIGNEVNARFLELTRAAGEYLVTDEDDTMQVVVSKLLKKHGQTLATAESCTGGYIAHLLTAEPGASAFFKGSVISYSNDVKQELLSVPEQTLLNGGCREPGNGAANGQGCTGTYQNRFRGRRKRHHGPRWGFGGKAGRTGLGRHCR